jgi:hypothetical protein
MHVADSCPTVTLGLMLACDHIYTEIQYFDHIRRVKAAHTWLWKSYRIECHDARCYLFDTAHSMLVLRLQNVGNDFN